MTDTNPMTNADRQALIRIVKARAKQAEREAEMREKIVIVEVLDLMTAEYAARDELWSDAVAIAEEAAAKANTQIQLRCAELGIPAKHAPQLELGWRSRSGEFINPSRRAELRKLAEAKAPAVTKTAKTAIQFAALNIEERLVDACGGHHELSSFGHHLGPVCQPTDWFLSKAYPALAVVGGWSRTPPTRIT